MKNLVIIIKDTLDIYYLKIFENFIKLKFNNLRNFIKFNDILLFLPKSNNDEKNEYFLNLFKNEENLITFYYDNLKSFFCLLNEFYINNEKKEEIFFLLYNPEYIFFDIKLNEKILEESVKYDVQYYYGEGFPEGLLGQVFKYEIIEDILNIIKNNDTIKKNFIFDIILRNITNFDIDLIEGNENFEAFRTSFSLENKEDIVVIIRIIKLLFLLKDFNKEFLLNISKEDFFYKYIEFEDYSDYYNNIFFREKLKKSQIFQNEYDFNKISSIIEDSFNFFDLNLNYEENLDIFKSFIFENFFDKKDSKEFKIFDKEIENIFDSPYYFIDNILRIFPELIFSYPKTIVLEISSKCSFSCSYCPHTYDLRRKKEFLSLNDIKKLYEKNLDIFKYSVFIIGGFGEPFENEEAFEIINFLSENHKVFIETNCSKFTSDITKKINNLNNVFFIFNVDAYSSETYTKLGKKLNFAKLDTFCKYYLEKYPQNFFIQFVRMKENDDELELFYEKWRKFEENIIFRKYNNFSGFLEDKDVVDLTPVVRYPCFHIRRDLYILSDGSISLCKSDFNGEILNFNFYDNDFNLLDSLNKKLPFFKSHCNKEYHDICKKCNEFYTFYF